MTKTCSTCLFWEPAPNDDTSRCRRNPPTVIDFGPRSIWPLTRHDDWCGEHKPREATNA